MSADRTFPPVPSDLKDLAPFFQRAQELKVKDPVMAYWCTYYAAKQGISSKVQSKDVRPFLFKVMTVLEEMKAALGSNDAVSDDDVGAAYIENFALRVFAMADNEDRKGQATRSTAKKFLAAANFLELLKIFDKPIEADITEKIRYSKWKAADIAKAFREGRQPAPGDAQQQRAPAPASGAEPASTLELPSGMSAWSPGTTSPAFVSPAPRADVPLPPEAQPPSTPPRPTIEQQLNRHDAGYATPGAWSTIATPGTEDVDRFADITESPSERAAGARRLGSGDMGGAEEEDAWSTVANTAMSRQGSWTAGPETPQETNGAVKWEDNVQTSSPVAMTPPVPIPKKVHFSPSVVGGLSSTASSVATSSPPGSPERFAPTLPTVEEGVSPREDPSTLPLPESSEDGSPPARNMQQTQKPPLPPVPPTHLQAPEFVSAPHQFPDVPSQVSSIPPQAFRAGPQFPSAPPQGFNGRSSQFPSAPPEDFGGPTHFPSAPPHLPPPSVRPISHPYGVRANPLPPPPPPPPLPELSTTDIANVQKHCKFAISALDYEDVDTARKELLTALALLGG